MRKGTRVEWLAKGPWGETWREGVIRARVKRGQEIKLPKGAKLKASIVNSRYDRYLVEIPRVDGRNGAKLASLWMAPFVEHVDACRG